MMDTVIARRRSSYRERQRRLRSWRKLVNGYGSKGVPETKPGLRRTEVV